jgi:hypothetical protein
VLGWWLPWCFCPTINLGLGSGQCCREVSH